MLKDMVFLKLKLEKKLTFINVIDMTQPSLPRHLILHFFHAIMENKISSIIRTIVGRIITRGSEFLSFVSAVGESLAIVDVVVSIRTVKSLKGKRNTKLNIISKLTSLFNTNSFLFLNILINNQSYDITRTFGKSRLYHLSERQFILAMLSGF